MPLPRLFNPKWSSMRCTAMRGKSRCIYTVGHAGWHHDGAWAEWLADDERKAAYKQDPCKATVMVDNRMISCELPSKHTIAHRGDDMIWTDPNPLPTAIERRYWFREQEAEEVDPIYGTRTRTTA